ncbi:MAG: ammonium transporter [Alphaproteobacteria bacterium]|nr:MAG: ammonium transporter [Alphaproteobacteria bacterium]
MILNEGLSEYFDILWLVMCAILVILMQAGFTCLESGLVRAKNSIHVAGKNVVDFCIASLLFWLFGFGIMFGVSWGGIIGTSYFMFGNTASAWLYSFFLFQMAFCAIATTIVSGAVAERIRFTGYVLCSCILSSLIYPVAGHWAWGGSIPDTNSGWLAKLGFIDFAGSTVVHSVGGWMALAALLIVGPRIGRFGPQGAEIEGSDLPKATLGLMLLWVGWFGFTGGSLPQFTGDVPLVIVNTTLGGGIGGLTALALSWHFKGRPNVIRSISCVIAGLVSISACAHMITPYAAVIIGMVGGVVCYAGTELLLKLEIDDVINAVPAHLFAGIWGTLAVALFAPTSAFGTDLSRLEQFWVQLLGVISVGAYSFTVGFILLSVIDRFFALRVDPESERIGLNVAEHGANTSLLKLLQQMEQQRLEGDFSRPVEIETETEAGTIAMQYNMILDKFNSETQKREKAVKEMRTAKDAALMASKTKSRFLANVSHELRTPLNAIMGFSEAMQTQILGPLGHGKYVEYSDHIFKSGQHLLNLIKDVLDLSKMEEGKLDLNSAPVNLHQVIARVRSFVDMEIQNAHIKLTVDIPEDIPRLNADERAMTQILTNLLSNAVKFSHDGGGIDVKAWLREDMGISILVRDNGSGMEPDSIDRAMEPFIQVDSQISRRHKGTGLGLPITKSLVELHGGTITLESALNEGTTVTIHMPKERTILGQAA